MAITISRSHFNCSFWRSTVDLIAIAHRTVLTFAAICDILTCVHPI
ncbi:hypothetical protein NDA07_18040 [Microcoleus vaginatus DQ-U2]|nr:hypothetical protein [Microcoleus sp. FACHB-DQ6]